MGVALISYKYHLENHLLRTPANKLTILFLFRHLNETLENWNGKAFSINVVAIRGVIAESRLTVRDCEKIINNWTAHSFFQTHLGSVYSVYLYKEALIPAQDIPHLLDDETNPTWMESTHPNSSRDGANSELIGIPEWCDVRRPSRRNNERGRRIV